MANKLLLIEDVENLGRSGEIVSVKPGYSRNFLLPQGLAVLADKRTLRMQERLQEERTKKAVVDKKESEELASILDGTVVAVTVKVDHDGHMYGSVSAHDVIELIEKAHKTTLDKKAVVLKHPIRELGEHLIAIKLKEGVSASITIDVISEDPRFVVVKAAPMAEAEVAPTAE